MSDGGAHHDVVQARRNQEMIDHRVFLERRVRKMKEDLVGRSLTFPPSS